MLDLRVPDLTSKEIAEKQILVQQSQQIVDDGKLRVLRQALEFYAKGDTDGGCRALVALEISK